MLHPSLGTPNEGTARHRRRAARPSDQHGPLRRWVQGRPGAGAMSSSLRWKRAAA